MKRRGGGEGARRQLGGFSGGAPHLPVKKEGGQVGWDKGPYDGSSVQGGVVPESLPG